MCLITGANSGIGLAAAQKYAAAGYEVIMACRDEVKGQEAVKNIHTAVPEAKVMFMKVGHVLVEEKKTHFSFSVYFQREQANFSGTFSFL